MNLLRPRRGSGAGRHGPRTLPLLAACAILCGVAVTVAAVASSTGTTHARSLASRRGWNERTPCLAPPSRAALARSTSRECAPGQLGASPSHPASVRRPSRDRLAFAGGRPAAVARRTSPLNAQGGSPAHRVSPAARTSQPRPPEVAVSPAPRVTPPTVRTPTVRVPHVPLPSPAPHVTLPPAAVPAAPHVSSPPVAVPAPVRNVSSRVDVTRRATTALRPLVPRLRKMFARAGHRVHRRRLRACRLRRHPRAGAACRRRATVHHHHRRRHRRRA